MTNADATNSTPEECAGCRACCAYRDDSGRIWVKTKVMHFNHENNCAQKNEQMKRLKCQDHCCTEAFAATYNWVSHFAARVFVRWLFRVFECATAPIRAHDVPEPFYYTRQNSCWLDAAAHSHRRWKSDSKINLWCINGDKVVITMCTRTCREHFCRHVARLWRKLWPNNNISLQFWTDNFWYICSANGLSRPLHNILRSRS